MAADALSWTTLLGMGAADAALLGVGLGVGALVDALVGTAPVFLLIGLLLGIVGAIVYTVLLFRRYLNSPPDQTQ